MNAKSAHRIARITWWVIAAALVASCSKVVSGAAPKGVGGLVVGWCLIGVSYSMSLASWSSVTTQFRWVFITAAIFAFLSFGTDGYYGDWGGESVPVSEEAYQHSKPSPALDTAFLVFARVVIGCSIGVGAAQFVKSRD